MAVSSYGTNHPLAVKVWAKRLFVEALKQTKFSRFVGNTPASLVQRRTELAKGPGDRISIGLRMQFGQPGILGDATLEGNEEALQTFTDNLFIDQLRHATRTGGKMSQQRVPFEIREESMEGLRDWWADRLDGAFFNQIAGATVSVVQANATTVLDTTDTRFTGNQAAIAPDAAHLILAGQGTVGSPPTLEASLSATTVYNLVLNDIDRCVVKAKTLTPAIRPLKVNGEDKFVIFVHPNQTFTLRKNTNTGQYVDIQKAAMTGGQIANNPLFTGAIGEYNGTIIHEDARVPIVQGTITGDATPTRTNYFRAIFCGAQSAGFAIGQDNRDGAMTWVEELFDYENQLGVSAGLIFGLKKFVFNSKDFSTIVVSSWAPVIN